MLILFIILFILSCIILVKTSDWVIYALVGIAKAFGWSEFFITFCLMAAATSLPELFVGITSALNRQSQLSFGNIIGANVINLTLIAGLVAVVGGSLALNKIAGKRDAFWTGLFAFLPTFLILDGSLSRVDGTILLVIAVIYSSYFLIYLNFS